MHSRASCATATRTTWFATVVLQSHVNSCPGCLLGNWSFIHGRRAVSGLSRVSSRSQDRGSKRMQPQAMSTGKTVSSPGSCHLKLFPSQATSYMPACNVKVHIGMLYRHRTVRLYIQTGPHMMWGWVRSEATHLSVRNLGSSRSGCDITATFFLLF